MHQQCPCLSRTPSLTSPRLPLSHFSRFAHFSRCEHFSHLASHFLSRSSGFYVAGIPVWISWIKYISFIFYGFNLLQKIEFGQRGSDDLCVDFYKKYPDAPPGRTYCQVCGLWL